MTISLHYLLESSSEPGKAHTISSASQFVKYCEADYVLIGLLRASQRT